MALTSQTQRPHAKCTSRSPPTTVLSPRTSPSLTSRVSRSSPALGTQHGRFESWRRELAELCDLELERLPQLDDALGMMSRGGEV